VHNPHNKKELIKKFAAKYRRKIRIFIIIIKKFIYPHFPKTSEKIDKAKQNQIKKDL